MDPARRDIKVVGFLGISDYGLGQFEVLCDRYEVAFATAKKKSAAHASGLDTQLQEVCAARGIAYLGSVDANSEDVVRRAAQTDLVVIGGYDAILRGPVLEAPRHGVINTHLGVLPLNRGCCPSLWAQMHGLRQGYTTYQVGLEIDLGSVLDLYVAPEELGGLRDTNRVVYDTLAAEAVSRFGDALDRFEAGEAMRPCEGQEAYHCKGMPNDGWLSFKWSNAFLRRFSLALDFAPYLPGRTRFQLEPQGPQSESEPEPRGPQAGAWAEVSLSVEAVETGTDIGTDTGTDTGAGAGAGAGTEPCGYGYGSGYGYGYDSAYVGQVLEVLGEDELLVRTREGTARCRLRSGPLPGRGARLASGRPPDQGADGEGKSKLKSLHAIAEDFAGEVLPLEAYSLGKRKRSEAT